MIIIKYSKFLEYFKLLKLHLILGEADIDCCYILRDRTGPNTARDSNRTYAKATEWYTTEAQRTQS